MDSTSIFRSEIQKIVELLESNAVKSNDGSIGWVSIWPFENRDPAVIHDASLYRGQAGIGLFLAAYGHVTKDDRSLKMAHQVFQPWLKTPPEKIEINHANGMTGIGSLIYALMECSRLLNDPDYMTKAVEIAASVDIKKVQADEQHDVLAGNAGLLLVLTELLSVCEEKQNKIQRHALDTADALIEKSKLVESEVGIGWNTVESYPQTGFAHGVSGIAYALLKAGVEFSEKRYKKTGLKALEFEDSLYDPDCKNWATSSNRTRYQHNWCWGSEGILLSRFGIRDLGVDYTMPENSTPLLQGLLNNLPSGHSLCHGVAGRAMTLNYISNRISSGSEYENAATNLLEQVEDYRLKNGYYNITGLEHAPTSRFSLFRGIAGIGYAYLYDQYQNKLPNPLLLKSSLAS